MVCIPVSGTFLNTLKFQVKDCDPTTGEPDSDVGYADEYVVSMVNQMSMYHRWILTWYNFKEGGWS